MKLLFKDATGNDELKELLGFLDADIKYKNIKSDIISATNEVIDLIGQEMYDLAITAFEKASPTEDDLSLIHAIRYPIAVQGYRIFAPNLDLSHTNKGRVTRIEDKEQAPFEWMIERDNIAMERKYYKGLDDLIKYLDTNHIDAWKVTDAYKATQKLFIRTTADFDNYFPIGKSRLLLIKLAPGIRLAENREIKPRIGQEMYDTMKAALAAGTALDEAFHEKIKEALVYKAMAWAMRRLSVQLFPEGVLQSFVGDRITLKSKQVPIKSEAEAAAQNFDNDAQSVFLEIEEIIKQNIPEEDWIDEPDFYYDADDTFAST